MADYGVVPTGFAIKDYETIVTDIGDRQKSSFGVDFNTNDDSVAGIENGIIADKLAEVWEVVQAVYRSNQRDSASDEALDNVGEITGTTRDTPTKSVVDVSCTGTPTTALLAGRQVSTGAGDSFVSDADGTIAALSAWAITTAYVIGDRIYNGTKVYLCVVAGTSDGSGGPTGTTDGITDNTVTWDYLGDGTGVVDIQFSAAVVGATPIQAGVINSGAAVGSIDTPVSGWDGAKNILDGTQGIEEQEDPEFRLKQVTELSAAGKGTTDAIYSNVGQVAGVTERKVLENTTISTDANGLPGKSVEVIVVGGDAQDITDAIWEAKGGGIESFGVTAGTAVDLQGDNQTVYHTRPTGVDIYSDIEVTTNTDASEGPVYPADGDDQVKAALVAIGDANYGIADDVIAERIKGAAFTVDGVIDIPSFTIGTAPSPLGTTNILIGTREDSEFDTSRIVVTVTT